MNMTSLSIQIRHVDSGERTALPAAPSLNCAPPQTESDIAKLTQKAGSLTFVLQRAGGGSYWPDGNFSAALFESVKIRLWWNPLAVRIDLDGRTRRFHHPMPEAKSNTTITTSLRLLDVTGKEVVAPVRLVLFDGQSDDAADTGLRCFTVNQILDLVGIDLSVVTKIGIFDQSLDPILAT